MDRTRITILLFMLAVSGIECKPPLTSGTTPQSYIRLLDADAPTGAVVMRTSSDGNMLFLYTAKVPGDSVTSIELTKTDVNGNVLWTQHYPATSTDNYAAGDCLSLADGSIAIAGEHSLGNYGAVTFFLLDANGLVTQRREYSTLGGLSLPNLFVSTLRQSDAGDLIIGSQSKDPANTGAQSTELDFLRLSVNGDSLGFYPFSTGHQSTNTPWGYGMSAMSAISGEAGIITGTYLSNGLPYPAIFQWESPDSVSLAGWFDQSSGKIRSAVQTGATSYIIAGDYNPFSVDSAWIAEVDAPFPGNDNLIVTWGRIINAGSNAALTSVYQTADKGLAATGYVPSTTGDTSILVCRFDAKGNDVWPYKTYDYAGGDIPNNIIELPSGDLIVGGVTTSFGARSSGARQIFLIHLKADGTPAS
jgi:hypothetical protein